MKRRLLSVVAAGAMVVGGLFSQTAQAHGPHHHGHCGPGGLYGAGYGGGYYGPAVPPYNIYSNRYAVPYGAGYSGGWQPYQGFYRTRPHAQVGLYFGF